MKTTNFGRKTGLILAVLVSASLPTHPANAILLTNGSLNVDIRGDSGAIDSVTFGGADFYNAGSPISDWGVQTGTDTATFRLNDTSGFSGIPVTTMSAPGEVTVTGTYTAGGANVAIVRHYELVSGVNVLRITTTLQNNGSALTLRYFDTFDPDQGNGLGLGFETFNDVFTSGALRIGQASATNDLTVRIAGPVASATVAAGSPFSISDGFALNDFFSAPFDGNGILDDMGMHIGYNVVLTAGASAILEYRHAYGTTATAAAAALCSGVDSDGDGFSAYCDNCPSLSNPGQEDADGDGLGDACDTCFGSGAADDDGDGFCTLSDNCPDDANPGQQDTDGNGVGDACNDAEDSDGDEWADPLDNCPNDANPGQEDADSNGLGNACNDAEDGDGDEWADALDNCPNDANPGQQDADNNGVGDACNDAEDTDGDEWADAFDNCPNDANPGQEDTDGNGTGDACNDAEDSDGDEWADAFDSCPDDPNPDQENLNGNEYGDACEPQGRLDSAGCYSVSDTIAPPDGSEPTFSFIDISGTGTFAGVLSHSVSNAIPIGFPFTFYGTNYSSVYISGNGFLSFFGGQGEGCCGTQSLPSTGAPDAVIAGFWAHLHMPSGAVYYQTLGSSPTRRFVVQFQNVVNFTAGGTATFEVILHEDSDEIEVQYANAHGTVSDGHAGIENQDGTEGLQWAGPEPVTLVNEAVRYSPITAETDGDGIWSCVDNCPTVFNPGQEDTCPAAPGGDACGADGDGDSVLDLCDNCPAIVNPGQEDSDNSGIGDACNSALDMDGDEFEDATDNCPSVANPAIDDVGVDALTQLRSGLNSNNAALTALVPNRFDFFEGSSGVQIGDGGNDMYDGGNVLNTNLFTFISYTNGSILSSNAQFGAGSSYFTAKYTGLFVMAATDLDITRFNISGNNGADGAGNADAAVLSTSRSGQPYTIYVKRVFNSGNPSINHIIIVPGTGAGVSYLYGSNTDNGFHQVDGLGSVQSVFFILVSRQNGLYLDNPHVISIANNFLSNFDQIDTDGDGFGDACDPCFGTGTDDPDGDGYCTTADNCPFDANPGQEDTCPASPAGDACDTDSDGDAIYDPCDFCVGPGADDVDFDGVCALADNCPNDANPGLEDADTDDVGDVCDNCVMVANPGQDDSDADNIGDACNDAEDSDGDEWSDALDNCPVYANPTQEDADGDGQGDTCDLEPFVSYKIRAPRTDVSGNEIDNQLAPGWVITVNDIHIDDSEPDDPENYEVMSVNGLLNPAQLNQFPSPNLNGVHYLRYRMTAGDESVAPPVGGNFAKPPRRVARVWQLQNQFGSINVASSKVSGLLLPANASLFGSPSPPTDTTPFVCYRAKATNDITSQTPQRRPGSSTGKFRKDLQAYFEDQFDDCQYNTVGTISFLNSGAAGKCLFDLDGVKELCNPIETSAVEAPRQTTASFTPATPATSRSLLCYQTKLARQFTTGGTAALANEIPGANLQPKQKRHNQRRVASFNPVHTAPGSLFPNPLLVDTTKADLICLPTEVLGVAPAP